MVSVPTHDTSTYSPSQVVINVTLTSGSALSALPQRCELCPHKDGALKRTDSGGKNHLLCLLQDHLVIEAEGLHFIHKDH